MNAGVRTAPWRVYRTPARAWLSGSRAAMSKRRSSRVNGKRGASHAPHDEKAPVGSKKHDERETRPRGQLARQGGRRETEREPSRSHESAEPRCGERHGG